MQIWLCAKRSKEDIRNYDTIISKNCCNSWSKDFVKASRGKLRLLSFTRQLTRRRFYTTLILNGPSFCMFVYLRMNYNFNLRLVVVRRQDLCENFNFMFWLDFITRNEIEPFYFQNTKRGTIWNNKIFFVEKKRISFFFQNINLLDHENNILWKWTK